MAETVRKYKYNHACDVAFEVESNHPEGDDITPTMYAIAILRRVADLLEDDEMEEAIGKPFDTYAYEDEGQVLQELERER